MAKPAPKFPRAQSHEVTSAKKNSFSPPLIPIREKKKNEPCLGRKQKFPQASPKVETLKSLVGSHQGEALPGFIPLNLHDELVRKINVKQARCRALVSG